MSLTGTFFDGHLYQFFNETITWNAAHANAERLTECSMQGHLVSITSQQEKDFVDALFQDSPTDRFGYWIGLNDKSQEGTFEWTTGETLSFTSWSEDEPNNLSEEHCVHTSIRNGTLRDRTWNDEDCDSRKFPYIVEYDCEHSETYQGHMYVATGVQRNWNQANRNAQARRACGVNGHLVTITSQEEQDFVMSLYERSGLPFSRNNTLQWQAWIGLSDLFQEGVFQWVTGEPYVYNAWALNEPNNFGKGEDCVSLIARETTMDWNDAACNTVQYPAVIEFDCAPGPTATVVPTATPLSELISAPTDAPSTATTTQPAAASTKSEDSAFPRALVVLSLSVLIPIIIVGYIYLRKRFSRRGVRKEDPPATGDASHGAPSNRIHPPPFFKDQCQSHEAPPLAIVAAVPLGDET